MEEDSRWADISDDSTDIFMEADSAVAMARSKEDVASQLYQTFAWIKYVANTRRRGARDMERAAKHWRRNVRSEPLGLHFEVGGRCRLQEDAHTACGKSEAPCAAPNCSALASPRTPDRSSSATRPNDV